MIKAAAAERHGKKTDVLAADIGQRIHKARVDRGMSLAMVGGEDLSRSFLSLVEHGQSRISLRALAIVAERLELPMTYFLVGTAASPHASTEIALDQAEIALRRNDLKEVQRLLPQSDDVTQALRGRALWLRGWLLIEQGKSREAIPLLTEAVALAEKNENVRERVRARYTLALALYNTDSHDEALEHLRPALSLAMRELNDRALMGKITVCIGHISYLRGNHSEALEQFARARQLFDTVDDPTNLASLYAGLSRVAQQKGETDEAFRYSRLSMGIHEQWHNEREAARELTIMADRSRDLGKVTEAREYAERAVELARKSKAKDIEALAHSALAAIYLEAGKVEAASAEAEAAEQTAGSDSALARIEAWLVQARIAALSGDSAKVDDLFKRALEALNKTGNHWLYADRALEYSELLQARGDTDGALKHALASARVRAKRTG
jgi:HTH-type transcriptional regulator, quorum sensing regulator NprR